MRTIIIGIAVCLFFLLLTACKGNAGNNTQSATDSIASVTDSLKADIRQWDACFPELVLGKQGKPKRTPVPHALARSFYPDFGNDTPDGAKEALYAIGKITGYKGFDLYICDYDYDRPEEDSYDNHTDANRFLLLYKDGHLLTEKGDASKPIFYMLGSHYYGEGGESQLESYFDKDTTLVMRHTISESESATGFQTPIITTKEFRTRINAQGRMKMLEISHVAFSSPFFDKKELAGDDDYYRKAEAGEFRMAYPTKDDRFPLNFDYFNFVQVSEEHPAVEAPPFPVTLYFYCERIDGEVKAIFESRRDEELIDRYVLGQSAIGTEKDYTGRPELLKCPVLIETSDGDVELLPNGKFVKHH